MSVVIMGSQKQYWPLVVKYCILTSCHYTRNW